MNWKLLLVALPLCVLLWGPLADAQQDRGKDKVKPLAGWPGVFPEMTGWQRTFQQPEVGKEDRKYGQTVKYEWTGGAAKTLEVALTRSPDVKTQFDPKRLAKLPDPPREVKVGKFTAWRWDNRNQWQRLAVVLAEDRVLTLTAHGPGPWEEPELLVERFDLEKLARALDATPRTDFRRTVEAFRRLQKGMSYNLVREWVGDADRDMGSGIHIMVYELGDDSRVLIGFPGFEKLIYVKHFKGGKVEDLVK